MRRHPVQFALFLATVAALPASAQAPRALTAADLGAFIRDNNLWVRDEQRGLDEERPAGPGVVAGLAADRHVPA